LPHWAHASLDFDQPDYPKMRKLLLFFSCLVLGALVLQACSDDETKPQSIVCESTYALCTTAQCTPIQEGQAAIFCDCEVKTGYSVGGTLCHAPIDSPEGKQIVSRYYPVRSYAACTNDRPWAWCFDRPCIVDKDDPSKAVCACNIVKDKGPYVIVTDSYSDTTCTTGLYSSAPGKDLQGVTDSLKTNEHLKAFDLKVVNP
jgi:hypothetical protein